MIFLTIGMQLPFDRLVRHMDELALRRGLDVVGQIGQSDYVPSNFESHRSIAPKLFDDIFRRATLVVAHAGIGTMLTAQKYGKPIILVPRRVAFGEHRNDHQLATCAQLRGRPGIMIADDVADIEALLGSAQDAAQVDAGLFRQRTEFTNKIRNAIDGLLSESTQPHLRMSQDR